MTLMPLAFEKMPSVPSAGNPWKTILPDALISALPSCKKFGSAAVSTIAVSGPPRPEKMLEVAPPWVRTELMSSQDAAQAMPLDRFIAETLQEPGTDVNE